MVPPMIAIVDDDYALQDVLRDLLEGEGYQVVAALDTASGLALVREPALDVLVLDLRLERPDSGLDVLQALFGDSLTPPTAVIVCTADAAWLTRHAPGLRDLGFLLLGKPFNLDDLLALVQLALGSGADQTPQVDPAAALAG